MKGRNISKQVSNISKSKDRKRKECILTGDFDQNCMGSKEQALLKMDVLGRHGRVVGRGR